MAIVTINDSNLSAIGDAIRSKNGELTTYKPSEMAAAITAISSGGGGAKPFSECQYGELRNRYASGSSFRFDLTPYVDDFAKIQLIIVSTEGISGSSNAFHYIWSPYFGTKYCIQVGGAKSTSISSALTTSFVISDDASTNHHIGSTYDSPSMTILIDGLKFTIVSNGGQYISGSSSCMFLYEE